MSGAEQAQVITAYAALIAAVGSVGGLVISAYNRKNIGTVDAKVDGVIKATDGMKTELVEAVKQRAAADATLAEKDAQSVREGVAAVAAQKKETKRIDVEQVAEARVVNKPNEAVPIQPITPPK